LKNFNKKTDISTGIGSCARNGTSDSKTFYCGTGPECNKFAGYYIFDNF
jgi:hypothetical protein